MLVPIIVLNYNSSDDCRKCISSLKKQIGVDIEIIVVDNCSSLDGEKENIIDLCKDFDCTFISANENKGYNAGNNIGLRYAYQKGYKYALIANPDMLFPETDYLLKVVSAMEKDSDIVVCGTDIVNPEEDHQNPMKLFSFWTELFWVIVSFKQFFSKSSFLFQYENSHYCEKVSGCCLMVDLSFINSINYFDENLFLYCEEQVLACQVKYHRKKIYYLASVKALHNHIGNLKGNKYNNLSQLCKSRIYCDQYYSEYNSLQKSLLRLFYKLRISIFSLLIKI